MPVIGEQIVEIWYLRDATGALVTGKLATITATLYRESGTTAVAAAEVITAAEIGVTGIYTFAYTPANAGRYVLDVYESTLQAEWTYPEDVQAVAATISPALANCYCATADIQAYAQMGAYGAATIPSLTQVLIFAETRASEIYSVLSRWMGDSTPGPTGYALAIDTSTDKGKALADVCRMANAVGAAMDAVEASGAGESPSRSERVKDLATLYSGLITSLEAAAGRYIGTGGMAGTHISTGEATAWSPEGTVDELLPIRTTTRF